MTWTKFWTAMKNAKSCWAAIGCSVVCLVLAEIVMGIRRGLDPDSEAHFRLIFLAGFLYLGQWIFTALGWYRLIGLWKGRKG